MQAFAGFAQIARRTNPAQYVSSGWHSSRTKVIDNALIGFISDQQAAAEKSDSKMQRASAHNFADPIQDVPASKPFPRSAIAAILNWFRNVPVR